MQLLQIFLNNHVNSGVILNYAWHSRSLNLKIVLVHAMAEWYSKSASEGDSEHNRLSRLKNSRFYTNFAFSHRVLVKSDLGLFLKH